MTHASDALTIDPNQRLQKKVQELETGQAQEIELPLRQRDAMNTDAISTLSDKLAFVMKEMETLKKNSHF